VPGAARDRRLADLEVVAAERLADIKKLEQSAVERGRQMEELLAERSQLVDRVDGLTGEVERLNAELEHARNSAVQRPSTTSSPGFRHSSPSESRRSSPVQTSVISELRELLESNQMTAKRLKDELNQMRSREEDWRSRSEDWAVAGLQNVYRDLSNCCTELEASLHHSATDVQRLFTPQLVSDHTLLLRQLPLPHHTTTVLRPFFQDHPGEPVPEENFWTLWCKGRLTEDDTPTIQLGATQTGLSSPHLHHPPHFLQTGGPSCRPTNSVKALKATRCI